MKDNKPHFISVIINCYNSDKYLREAIESVLKQTYEDWEIIFWDNQSTDKSAAIINSYNDSRIKYFYAPKHTTLGAARNCAVEKAKGEWLAFLDCDDIWTLDKLQKQVSVIEEEDKNLGLVYSRALIKGGKYEGREYAMSYQNRPLPEGNILKEYLLNENFIPLMSAMVRRSIYHEVGGIPEHYKQCEDFYLFSAVAAKYWVRAINEYTCFYRIHENNISTRQKSLTYIEMISVLNNFWPLTKDYQRNSEVKNSLLREYKILSKIFMLQERQKCFSSLSYLVFRPFLTGKLIINHFYKNRKFFFKKKFSQKYR